MPEKVRLATGCKGPLRSWGMDVFLVVQHQIQYCGGRWEVGMGVCNHGMRGAPCIVLIVSRRLLAPGGQLCLVGLTYGDTPLSKIASGMSLTCLLVVSTLELLYLHGRQGMCL